MSILHRIFLAAALLTASGTIASADAILYQLSGVNFSQPGSGGITGSFIFDTDTDTYTAVELAVGSTTYSYVGSNSSSTLLVAEANPSDTVGDPTVWLNFAAGILDTGGTVQVTAPTAGTCGAPGCLGLSNFSFGFSGQATGTSVGPLLWILSGINFSQPAGGGITGYFVFDPGTNAYNDVALADGSTLYSYVGSNSTSSHLIAETNPSDTVGAPGVWLDFPNGGLAAGQAAQVLDSIAGTCELSGCQGLLHPRIGSSGAAFQPFPAPEPGSSALESMGLIVLAAFLHRRSRPGNTSA